MENWNKGGGKVMKKQFDYEKSYEQSNFKVLIYNGDIKAKKLNKEDLKIRKVIESHNTKVSDIKSEMKHKDSDGMDIKKAIYKIKCEAEMAIKNINKSSCIKADVKVKLDVRQKMIASDKISKISYVSGNVIKLNKKITKHTEYVDYISKVNLSCLFNVFDGWDIGKIYSCPIIDGNFGWISKDDNGFYRYFTKTKDGHSYSLSFLDLIEVIQCLFSLA